MKVIKYIRKEYKDIKKGLLKRTAVFNRKKILHKKYRKISFIVIALLVIVNMTIFSFNAFSQMGVQEANSLESYAVVAYTEPGSHTWTVPTGVSSVDVLVVAGGGGGGGHRGGGGGAGELIFKNNYLVSAGDSILVEVGNGGSGGANNYGLDGEDSKFDTIIANGGGGGAPHGSAGNSGGSGGGGGCDDNNGGASIVNEGFGNAGGYGPDNWSNTGSAGGGGGAGGAGLMPDGASGYIDYPGNGGDGLYYGDIFGDNYGDNGWFAGGGGGGTEGHSGATNNSPFDRPIGSAGGGDGGMIEYINPRDPGSSYNQHNGTDAINGTGSGGGGGNYSNTLTTYGGNGGSGIVLIRYKVNLGQLQGSTLNKSLVGHWSMDEVDYNSSNNRVTDKTPYVNHGTNYGATFTQDRFGKEGGAMSFDGSNDYIDCGNSIFRSDETFTVSLFFNRNSNLSDYTNHSVHNMLLAKASSSYNDNFELGTYGNNIELYLDTTGSNTTRTFTTEILNNKFYHLSVTFDNGLAKIYLNGEFLSSSDWGGILDSSAHSSVFAIGESQHAGAPFNGLIDDVRIYNRALSETEIQSLYDSYEPKISAGSLNKGLVLDMPLTLKYTKDETSGSEIMTDKTPYSNDGQNYGATISEEGASFDGVNDYIDLGDNLGNALSSNHTISFWSKYTSGSSWTPFIGKDGVSRTWIGTDGGWDYQNSVGADKPVYTVGNMNLWNYYVIVADASGEKYYINGNYVADSFVGRASNNTNHFLIGFDNGGAYGSGIVKKLKIYNRTLSDQEVKSLYDKGRDTGSGMIIKPYGSVSGMAGMSCLDILNNNPSAINNDGVYWIDPDGTGAFQVYCDMTTDGGGWTRLWFKQDQTDGYGFTACESSKWDSYWSASPVYDLGCSGISPTLVDITYYDESGSTITSDKLNTLSSYVSETRYDGNFHFYDPDSACSSGRYPVTTYNNSGPSGNSVIIFPSEGDPANDTDYIICGGSNSDVDTVAYNDIIYNGGIPTYFGLQSGTGDSGCWQCAGYSPGYGSGVEFKETYFLVR
jgi:hypothetical protein